MRAGDGFACQLGAVDDYARANGIKIAKVYREEGVTGTIDGRDRPAWVEMVGRIMTNGIRTIMIDRLDRSSPRSDDSGEHIIADLLVMKLRGARQRMHAKGGGCEVQSRSP